jgi:molybdopterin/thiamine biosynthesis adenylyltransferase
MSTTLTEKSALVLGAGGLGGAALLVLASAGVGRLLVGDDACLETSDLNRQPLFGEADLGERRAVAAARRLSRLFPSTRVELLQRPFDASGAVALVGSVDVLVDASGDVSTQFLANDAALSARRPLVHGGVIRYAAQLLTVVPGTTGCLRCLFEAPPPAGSVPTTAEAGVVGPLAGFAGALMGAEAVRLLLGGVGTYAGQLQVYESRRARARTVPVSMREGCPVCQLVRAASPVPS